MSVCRLCIKIITVIRRIWGSLFSERVRVGIMGSGLGGSRSYGRGSLCTIGCFRWMVMLCSCGLIVTGVSMMVLFIFFGRAKVCPAHHCTFYGLC